MNLTLITYQAEDGLELDGAYYTGSQGARSARPLIVLTHGAWMNFYTGPPRFLPEALVPMGFDCLAMNTRDHDLGGIHPRTGRCFGMIRSRFEEIVPDLAGALAWGGARGYRRFILVCHSYSGQRAAYYLSRRTAAGVAGLVMLSPPVSLGTVRRYWLDDWERFTGRARELVAAGRPDEILVERAAGNFPIIASAATILSLWVNGTPLENSAYLQGQLTPLLVTLGGKEALQDPPRRNVERIASAWAGPVTRAVIDGAGHYYHENPQGLIEAIARWLAEAVPAGDRCREMPDAEGATPR